MSDDILGNLGIDTFITEGIPNSSLDLLERLKVRKRFEQDEENWDNFTSILDLQKSALAKNHFQTIEHDRMLEAIGVANPKLEKKAPEQWFDPQMQPFIVAFQQAHMPASVVLDMAKSLHKSGKSVLPSEAMTSLYEKYESRFTPQVKELILKAIKACDFSLFCDLFREFAQAQ